jgi:hypothetical protein
MYWMSLQGGFVDRLSDCRTRAPIGTRNSIQAYPHAGTLNPVSAQLKIRAGVSPEREQPRNNHERNLQNGRTVGTQGGIA